ncbi:hypothetical protein Dda_4515 [Drechslerella dactyloides]|uniref:HPt domain-containing protein n=1 Tax=Drechslerella dactyloides TaxID=74499 RepID=A0AAD6NJC7_DREDA|nr:hypothetical protein Dda_4515 [Drechslerella dactyloides]
MSDDETGSFDLPPDARDYVELETFEQILEMDDDDDTREFSHALVLGFFEQAQTTFEDMDQKVMERDLGQLSALGHFLKGSSATLGISKVRDCCEKIQHLGALKDETGNDDISEDKALEKIRKLMPTLKSDFEAAKSFLERFYYREDGADAEE